MQIPSTHDFTPSDLQVLRAYLDQGLPASDQIDAAKSEVAFNLYLFGKPYSEVARLLSIKKELILYASCKGGWFKIKQDYLSELEERLPARIAEAKAQSKELVLQLFQYFNATLVKQMGVPSAGGGEYSEVDFKSLDRLLKIVDAINKFGETGTTTAASPGLAQEVQAAPRPFAGGKTLKELADQRRREVALADPKNKGHN